MASAPAPAAAPGGAGWSCIQTTPGEERPSSLVNHIEPSVLMYMGERMPASSVARGTELGRHAHVREGQAAFASDACSGDVIFEAAAAASGVEVPAVAEGDVAGWKIDYELRGPRGGEGGGGGAAASGRALGSVCDACGAAAPSGRRFQACSGCRKAAFCGKDCQRAAWPQHRLACAPERLRPDRPAESAALETVKAACVQKALRALSDEMMLAHVSWNKRLGKGVTVAWMQDWVNLAAPSRERECQLTLYYVPASDFKGARANQPAVLLPLSYMTASEDAMAQFEASDPREAFFVVAADATGWGRTLQLNIAPRGHARACERAIAAHPDPAVSRFDIFAIDLNRKAGSPSWTSLLMTLGPPNPACPYTAFKRE